MTSQSINPKEPLNKPLFLAGVVLLGVVGRAMKLGITVDAHRFRKLHLARSLWALKNFQKNRRKTRRPADQCGTLGCKRPGKHFVGSTQMFVVCPKGKQPNSIDQQMNMRISLNTGASESKSEVELVEIFLLT